MDLNKVFQQLTFRAGVAEVYLPENYDQFEASGEMGKARIRIAHTLSSAYEDDNDIFFDGYVAGEERMLTFFWNSVKSQWEFYKFKNE